MHSLAVSDNSSSAHSVCCQSTPRGKAAKVTYLWANRIPFGAITFLEGRKGVGKSTIAAAIAADVTGGPRLPGNGRKRKNGAVVWQTLEESMRLAVYPRFRLAGAVESSCLHLVNAHAANRVKRLQFPNDLQLLADTIKEKKVKLLVLDPWTSFLDPNIRVIDEQQIRPVLEELAAVLEDTQCAGVFMRHLTKVETREAMNQGAGSVAVAGVARSILRVDRHPLERGRNVLAHVATNLGPISSAMVFELIGGGDVAKVKWHGEEELDADDLAAGQGDAGQRDERTDAERLLRLVLAGGWVKSKDVIADARSTGIGERTLRKAKAALGVGSKRSGDHGEHYWMWGPPLKGWK